MFYRNLFLTNNKKTKLLLRFIIFIFFSFFIDCGYVVYLHEFYYQKLWFQNGECKQRFKLGKDLIFGRWFDWRNHQDATMDITMTKKEALKHKMEKLQTLYTKVSGGDPKRQLKIFELSVNI